MGIFSWGKYAKIIVNAESRFVRNWNYDMTPDEKTEEGYMVVAITALFIESEQSSLEPNGFAKMVSGIRKSSPLFNLIGNMSVTEKKALSTYYSHMYGFYLSARRQGMSRSEASFDAADRVKTLGIT
jgi:hypothetical protein